MAKQSKPHSIERGIQEHNYVSGSIGLALALLKEAIKLGTELDNASDAKGPSQVLSSRVLLLKRKLDEAVEYPAFSVD
ncbi:unnamed protein product [Parascedosporium putredinis]|uniref:Uncharacterized protein n=1 Tax=Parascedosporium putredinis TaxID=1442378 RepID=A0A9P1H6G9_9PEZI|nr:unnamed protein product [Parascedosporium putredinis]CAI7998681.1 unnamed protein product [Parascedosporium putredinis]